jgi:replication factor A1
MISDIQVLSEWHGKIGNPSMVKEGGKGPAAENAAGPVVPHHVPAAPPADVPPAAAPAPQQQQYHQPPPAPQQHHQQQQQPPYSGGGALGTRPGAGGMGGGPTTAAGMSHGAIMPISSLTTFTQRWTIKGRVTNKGDVKNWSNQRGQGKLFAVTIVDEGNAEIRATFFQAAVDKFFPMIEVGKVYYFGNGKVKMANTQYTSVKNSLEISFDDKAQVQPCADDSRISKAVYSFTKLEALSRVEPGKMIDVVGAVVSAGELTSIKTKKGDELQKRDFTIADDSGGSGATVSLTFWGQQAVQLEAAVSLVVRLLACLFVARLLLFLTLPFCVAFSSLCFSLSSCSCSPVRSSLARVSR